tara:strand:+ start:472 stop:948 length:477 start_codon:yes stop_codon:yes gene_type:complete
MSEKKRMTQKRTREESLKTLNRIFGLDSNEQRITALIDQLVELGTSMVPELTEEQIRGLCQAGFNEVASVGKSFCREALADFSDEDLDSMMEFTHHRGSELVQQLQTKLLVHNDVIHKLFVEKIQKPAFEILDKAIKAVSKDKDNALKGVLNPSIEIG